MSHELRTPLNSLLILADQLSSNPQGNLTPKQVEFARTIHGSGRDLLKLINDILDLSKIESGTVTVDVGEVRFEEMRQSMERTFRHVADGKGLSFIIEIERDLPAAVQTDAQRLDQVLKNLLSNAFKFTERGYVNLRVFRAREGWNTDRVMLNRAPSVLAFAVSDSGLGIHPDKQSTIFEAFHQADGSTSRRYGGTGLGLAISRELARLLGGEICLESAEGRGSTFTLYLPQIYTPAAPAKASSLTLPAGADAAAETEAEAKAAAVDVSVPDDRGNILPGEKSILIVEDDRDFAQWLLDSAHDKSFKAIVTSRGHSALSLVREFAPTAITLDITLPDLNGWKVLDRLKGDLNTRHIPVFIISVDEEPENALKYGALCFFTKPIGQEDVGLLLTKARAMAEKESRELLLIEDNKVQRDSVRELIGNETAHVVEATNAQESIYSRSSSSTASCSI